MVLNEKQRKYLNYLSSLAQNLSNALRDASQLAEKGHFTTKIALNSARILVDKIDVGFEMFEQNNKEQLQ